MKQIFTREADLSGIDGKKDLEVSKVIHKVVVEVNEEGSEAAAATTIFIRAHTTSVHPEPTVYEFKAYHPFMFFIRDNRNGMNLFVGQINEL
jgi:serpin B